MADIVFISTADWDHPLWTNKQHVACSLADQGHQILYIESLGIRSAHNTSKDLFRLFRRLIKSFLPPRNVYKKIWVWSPLVLPGRYKGFGFFINKINFYIGLNVALFLTGINYEWLWTYNPLIRRLVKLERFSLKIYHAVDAIHEQPYMNKDLIKSEERKLCSLVDQVFVTSPKIELDLKSYSNRLKYYSNVCDFKHFYNALNISAECIPADLSKIRSPRIGFIGAISSYKLDFKLIEDLAFNYPTWNFVFIGPTAEGEKKTNISFLEKISNIYFLGHRPYSQLPRYCAGLDVGLLPLQINPYTKSMFPMKFFEYLAAGLPVVSSSLPSLLSFKNQALLCEPDVEVFANAIQLALSKKDINLDDRLALARKYTYHNRTKLMLNDIMNIVNT